jgi:DNA-binding MarR family transcriptional regulator
VSRRSGAEVDAVWQALVALVMDTRGDWRRGVSEATGLPFSRVRALRRIAKSPMTLRELADAMGCDAPAATVAVNDLEQRGLVERRADAEDRRVKIVSVTAEGKRAMTAVRQVPDRAPEAITGLPPRDVTELVRILGPLVRGSGE